MKHKWEDLPRDFPMDKLSRRRIVGENAMISEVLLEEGCVVPTHAHANEQISCILRGCLRYGIGEEGSADRYEVEARAGEVLILPPNVPHSAVALEETLVWDVFSPPSATTGVDRK